MGPSSLQIDVVIATFNRAHLLRRCLLSIVNAAGASSHPLCIRFLVCSSGDDAGYPDVLNSLRADHSEFEIIHTHSTTPLGAAAARNRLLPKCHGEWIYFIDDDAHIDADFFIKFFDILESCPNVGVIGGPNLTGRSSTAFQHASGAVLGSRFAASKCSRRYSAKKKRRLICGEESLISCSLFVRGDALKGLFFPEHLECNEENWLMQDLARRGHFFIYDANLHVWHERRPNVKLFMLQIYRYGIGRGQNMRLRPLTARSSHLLPSLSLILTSICFAVALWEPRSLLLWLTLLSGYAVMWIAAILRLEFQEPGGLRMRLMSALLFPVVHVSYGIGVLRGLVA